MSLPTLTPKWSKARGTHPEYAGKLRPTVTDAARSAVAGVRVSRRAVEGTDGDKPQNLAKERDGGVAGLHRLAGTDLRPLNRGIF